MSLKEDEKKKLLHIARTTVEEYISSGSVPEFDIDEGVLTEERGVFVTLHSAGRLRGCIGNIFPVDKLYKAVKNMAVASATSDPRFSPVKKEELEEIDIEISVLTVPRKVDTPEDIKLGRDGVIVKKGMRQGVYLPQVADETGWSKEEFLDSLCYSKAGLDPKAWKDDDTELLTFRAEVFSEKDFKNS